MFVSGRRLSKWCVGGTVGALVLLGAATVPVAAGEGRGQPAPLPGYPSCDYSKWRIVNTFRGGPAVWSPDGTRLLQINNNGRENVILDAETGSEVGRVPWEGTFRRPSWSRDGKTIVFDSSKDNPGGSVEEGTVPGPGSEGEGQDLWAYDVPTGRFSRLTKDVAGSNSYAKLSRHGRRLAWVRSGIQGETHFIPMVADVVRKEDGTYRLEDERELVTDPAHPGFGAFTRTWGFTAGDAGVLVNSTASNSGNDDVWSIDLKTGRWTNLTQSPYWEELSSASPNGQKIFFNSTRDYPFTANVLFDVSRMASVPAALDNVLIIPYAAGFAQTPVYGMSAEGYLANPDGTGQESLTFKSGYGIDAGWYTRGADWTSDGRKLAISQRPVTQVKLPGYPDNTIQFAGNAAGDAIGLDTRRGFRVLVLAFECEPPAVSRAGCLNGRGGVSGKRLGPAVLGRNRSKQRKAFRGARLRSRGGIDLYCATGGGTFRIGYPTRRLRRGLGRSLRSRIESRALFILTTSRRYTVRGIRPGAGVRALRRTLHGERRIRVGSNVWYVAPGRGVRLLYKTRAGRVLAVGIANRRVTATPRAQRRFLRAWELGA